VVLGETQTMLLRHRPPRIDNRPPAATKGFEHIDEKSIAVVRWLNANAVDYVLVGPVAAAARGQAATGPVAIVPSPYRRNFERLARALTTEQARIRIDVEKADNTPVKITAEKLARGQRWMLRCGQHDLDIEGLPAGAASYQELLYEATRFELADDVAVEVASPEDIEYYEHIRRTGTAPEIRITRNSRVQ
jgi:hypothetical protein